MGVPTSTKEQVTDVCQRFQITWDGSLGTIHLPSINSMLGKQSPLSGKHEGRVGYRTAPCVFPRSHPSMERQERPRDRSSSANKPTASRARRILRRLASLLTNMATRSREVSTRMR
jgi:hypothetical protein